MVEAVVVHQALRAPRRAEVHRPPVLQVDTGLESAALLHIVLQHSTLAGRGVPWLGQAPAGHLQAGGQPGGLVHHTRTLGERRELDGITDGPCPGLAIISTGVFSAGGCARHCPRLPKLPGASQGLKNM